MGFFTNRIYFGPGVDDYFSFDDLQGIPEPRAQQLEVILRPGKDDKVFRKTGIRADPVALRAVIHVDDRATAETAITAYVGTLDGDPHRIVQHSREVGYFVVEKVKPEPLQAMVNVHGALNPNAQIKLATLWTLHQVAAPEV